MLTRRKFLYFLLIILILGGIFFHVPIENFFLASKNRIADFKKNDLDEVLQNLEINVSTPPPLRSEKKSLNSILTQAGTINWTNINRKNNGLSALRENKKLNEAALEKAKDIFDKQYFDHISPSGERPQDLIEKAGYNYISTGENLAMGNFADDRELLDAWMASPGHRENILRKDFTEIGVAVLSGRYEEENIWVAVQEFGTPLSDCPAVDAQLKKTIESNSAKIDSLAKTLELKKDEVLKLHFDDSYLVKKIDEYNNIVKEYNYLVAKTKKQIKIYNDQVSSFNECVKKYKLK